MRQRFLVLGAGVKEYSVVFVFEPPPDTSSSRLSPPVTIERTSNRERWQRS
jgi:hypothetical protein